MKSIISFIVISFAISVASYGQNFIAMVKPMGKKEWGYVNSQGDMVINAKYRKCYPFSSEGLTPIYEGKKFSFINTKGEQIPTEISGFKLIEAGLGFGGLQGYSDGLIAVRKDKKWGFLNTDGKVAIELKYDKVSSFDNGFATARKGKTFYVLNTSGEETKIENSTVFAVKGFKEGLAPFYTEDKKNGFIDNNGKVAIQAQFANVGYFSNELAWAKTYDKKVGYINKSGEWAIKPKFDACKNFDPVSGMARVKINGQWAYTNKNGEIINVATETFGDFEEGLAKGKKDGKVGYYDAKGEWVIEPTLQGGRDFNNGFAAAKKNDKWGFINRKGEWVIEAKFAAVKDMEMVK